MELLIVNMALFLYLCSAIYRLISHKKTMSNGSHSHLISHIIMAGFGLISINIFIFKDIVFPLVFSALHVLQHFLKEDTRLIYTDKFTPSLTKE